MKRSRTRCQFGCVVLGFSALVSEAALAHVPNYQSFQLQARSNLCANQPAGYNLPCSVEFNSSTPALNNRGIVAIKLLFNPTNDRQGIWVGRNGVGTTAFEGAPNAFLSDVSINPFGYVAFQQTVSPQNGIWFYDAASNTSGLRTTQPFGTSSWGVPIVNRLGQIGFRATFSGGQAFYSLDGASSFSVHAAEVALDPQSPISFLFTASFNSQRQIAAKVRLGGPGQTGNSQPDEIRIFNADGSFSIIARDADAMPGSIFASFDNSVGFNSAGQVAFTAGLSGGGRGVFLSQSQGSPIPIAVTGANGVNEIEFFPPALNDAGLVAFRGRDSNNRQAIFVGDGVTLRRVIGQLDQLPSDLGTAQIAQHDSSTVFGGAVSINRRGDVAFNAALTPAGNNQVEWGSGVYIAYSDYKFADINLDGAVNVADLLAVISAWGACPSQPQECHADVAPVMAGDGAVNVADLLLVISNWG